MEAQKSVFRFTNFFVKESHFVFNNQGEYQLEISFSPSGIVSRSTNLFEMHLDVEVSDANNLFNIKIKTASFFEFDDELDINNNQYFTLNAPAIVFPYIRAYIANLTAQSGINTITLPTFNLTSLEDGFKENINITE